MISVSTLARLAACGAALAVVLTSCSLIPASAPVECTSEQVRSVAMFDADPSTITRSGEFPIPTLLTAGSSVVCSGDYVTSQPDAYRAHSSLAIVHGGDAVFDALVSALAEQGFPEASISGESTHGWNDGTTQIYAVRLADQLDDSVGATFGDDSDLIVIVTWPASESNQ